MDDLFRNNDLIDKMIEKLVEKGLDTIIAAVEEDRGILIREENQTQILKEGFMPRNLKKSKSFIGLVGLGLVSRPLPLRNNTLGSGRFDFFEANNPLSSFEIRDKESLKLAERLMTIN